MAHSWRSGSGGSRWYHVPELHGELDGAGDPLRGRRGRGWRAGSSSLSVKTRSSSTLSRSQARGRSSASAARSEAGGGFDSLVPLFDRCDGHSTRCHCVTSILHDNLGFTPHACSTARNSQYAHTRATGLHGREFQNSMNSVGDTEAGRRRFTVSGRTKSLRPSARCMVGRRAGKELALVQLASGRVHEETWAGCKGSLRLKISQELEIVPGCAVTVSYLPSPSIVLVPPEPGRMYFLPLLQQETR